MTQPLISESDVPCLKRVAIRNYKSIGKCEVGLQRLTIVVGRNGSGKSNFLDALRFIVDGLQSSLDHAIKARGGIEAVRRVSTGHPRNFTISVDLSLADWQTARYTFEIGPRPKGGFVVRHEILQIQDAGRNQVAQYEIKEGQLIRPAEGAMPPAVPDRLYLVSASSLPAFRPVFDALASMGFYNLNPEAMKELQSPDAGELLHRDGSNIASVIARLTADEPATKHRISQYLATIVPDISEVARVSLGPRETVEFRQKVKGANSPWRFYANSMSDGTLRALGTLVAVTQLAERTRRATLVGIEEPETALHPAAAAALMDALHEASVRTQIIVTSHSPDLLDTEGLHGDELLVAVSRQGDTEIGPMGEGNLKAIREHLYTPGELLRMDQLEPDAKNLEYQRQLQLFDFGEDED
jgi:predicted ATPase